jgi:hypothetical protein
MVMEVGVVVIILHLEGLWSSLKEEKLYLRWYR